MFESVRERKGKNGLPMMRSLHQMSGLFSGKEPAKSELFWIRTLFLRAVLERSSLFKGLFSKIDRAFERAYQVAAIQYMWTRKGFYKID